MTAATTTTDTFRVIRMYFSDDFATEVVLTGLTQAQAQAYCQDPQTSSSTCTSPEAVERTALRGAWFCGWEEDHPAPAPANLDELFAADTQGLLDDDASDDPYCGEHGERFDPNVGCSACLSDEAPADGQCRVRVTYDRDLGEEFDTPVRHDQTIDLPSWCSGDPAAGAALYLFGYAGAVDALHVTAEVIA